MDYYHGLLQLKSNVIKIYSKSLTSLGMTNTKGDKIRKQYFYNFLSSKLLPLTKNVP